MNVTPGNRIVRRIFPAWIRHLPANAHRVALTFDDGPDPKTTPWLLDVLARHELTSTMFLTGERCHGQESLIREIDRRGHQLANHGYRHESHLLRGPAYWRRSIRDTETAIRSAGVLPAGLFRPPHGSIGPFSHRTLRRMGYRGVLWSLMVNDWRSQSPSRLAQRIRNGLHEGMILVLHDGHSTTRQLAEPLACLADEVRSRGWQFTHLSPDVRAETVQT